jgi:hypothetical protein
VQVGEVVPLDQAAVYAASATALMGPLYDFVATTRRQVPMERSVKSSRR